MATQILSKILFFHKGIREGDLKKAPISVSFDKCIYVIYTSVMGSHDILSHCREFEWDEHNSEKNWQGHLVTPSECEEVFFNHPLIVGDDARHSEEEPRYYTLGRTDGGRCPFVVFTVREDRIRVISARDMSGKERKVYLSYEEAEENS